MFNHHRDAPPLPEIDPPRVRTVRLLHNDEELQAARERALVFERRDDRRQRRAGASDRFPNRQEATLADVASLGSVDERSAAVDRSAGALGHGTMAAGTEDEGTLTQIRSLGAELGQGWHTERPGPLAS